MIRKGSRYENAVPFRPAEGQATPFPGIRARAVGPAPGVLEHHLRDFERHDLLSVHYYNDAQLWWRILDANPDVLYAGDLAERDLADPILIPRAREAGAR